MGNSGFRKLLFPGDLSETKYQDIFEISVMDLDRNEIPLDKFKDSPCLIVNIASQNQDIHQNIQELKEITMKFDGKLKILAFPSNQFGNEPKDFNEIKRIYTEQLQINFPIFSKVSLFFQFI